MNFIYKINITCPAKSMGVLICLLITSWVKGQSVVIDGLLSSLDKPLPGAMISVVGNPQNFITDSTGRFYIQPSVKGKISLHITAVGCLQLDTVLFPPFPSQLNLSLQPANRWLDEVVVSGTMQQVRKTVSPIPVEVYTPVFFKKNAAPNFFEALQLVNGVQPQQNCNVCSAGDIQINGMEGPYTMVLIDGMPIVSSLSTIYGLSGIPTSMIQRVEIVKGPASALYGTEAIGGLINIITRDAVSAPRLKADVSYTGIGELNTDLSIGYKIGKTNAILGLNYFGFQQRRDINQDGFTDLPLQQRFSIFQKWQHAFNERLQTSLAVRFIQESRWGGELHWQQKYRGSDVIYGEQILTRRTELISNTRWGKHLHFDFSWNSHAQDSWYGQTIYFAKQQVSFAQLRWNKSFGKHSLLAGLPFRYTFFDDNTPATADTHGKNRPDYMLLPGLLLQDEWEINKRLLLLTGLRYDYHNHHGSIVTPRFSVKYVPQKGQTFRLSMGNGFRVVNLYTEDHAALSGAREVVVTEVLRPEKSWNLNLHYTRDIITSKGFGNFDISIFFTHFSNRIIADYFTDSRKIIYTNLQGYSISRGLTFNTKWNFDNGLKLSAGATLMDVFQVRADSLGKLVRTPQLFAPTISGTFSVSYNIRKILIDFTGRINGSMHLPVVRGDFRPPTSPWHALLNLQCTRPVGEKWELYGGVKNLLNFIPRNPILHPDDPFNRWGGRYFDLDGTPRQETNPNGYTFDASYNYAPLQGAKWFLGVRWQLR